MSRFTKSLALGAVTAGLLAASAGSALAGSRHTTQPPQSAAVSAVQVTGQGVTTPPESRHTT